MKNKIISLVAILTILITSIPNFTFAQENKKVLFINMNRTNLENMLEIPSIKETLDKSGYVGLMNIRGDQGTDDRRSFATMGAGGRANVAGSSDITFEELNENNGQMFETITGQKPKGINNININKSINENLEEGEYGSTLGSLGQSLSDNDLKTALIGNADILRDDELIKNRNLGLAIMDNYGRIDMGNIDDINKENFNMPYGISTDYEKLLEETKKFYNESDVLFVDLGDTYRLDEYSSNLNEQTYETIKSNIYKSIDKYMENIFELVGENDVIYLASGFPSDSDYSARKRLSPIIKIEKDGKGLLASSTTRRDGIVANLDIGVDILNEFDIENPSMVGKAFSNVDRPDNVEFILGDLEKIVSISEIRATVTNSFVGVISASWVLAMIAVLFRKYIPNKKQIFTILKEIIKLGMIMPLSFLVSPIFNFKTPVTITAGIIFLTLVFYIIGRMLFKDDIKHMGFFALATITVIVVDSVFGTYLMQNNIVSYDAIVGARYYGIGNEYEGITIGSAIFALAVLLNYKRIPKYVVAIVSIIILITSAYPAMGANVGGAISECIAYLLFILLIFDVKIDIKKAIMILIAAGLVVISFAVLDIVSGTESHLGLFVKQILLDPSVLIQTFTRKIEMNLHLAQTTVWVNILLAGVAIVAMLLFKPSKHFQKISDQYPIIFKGFLASMVGCIVTLLVNDSGIVAASTASIYILIPIIIISINMIIFKEK